MADGWQNQGGGSPGDELLQGLEDLKRTLQRFTKGAYVWLIIGAVALLWLGSGIYVVGPSERGIVLRFGAVIAETDPGLRFHFPWPIEKHVVVDIARVRSAQVGYRSSGTTGRTGRGNTRTIPQEALMLTGDENIVEVNLVVQYRIEDPVKFLFGAYEPEKILHSYAEVALRSAVGGNTIDYTMTDGRLDVQEQAKAALQSLLTAYDTGLIVTEARLLAVDPPTDVRDSFNDVVRALEDRDRLKQEAEGYQEDVVPKARGAAAQMVQQAEAYKAQRVIRANGDAERFLNILAEYEKAKSVTRDRLYLESIERIMPNMEKFILDSQSDGGGVVPLLPLRDMGAGQTAAGAVVSQEGR